MKATKVNAGLAESNSRLLPGIWRDSLHVTCGLTACPPGSAPGPTLGNEYGKTLPFYLYFTSTNLVSVGNVDRSAGLGDVSDDAAAPRHSPFLGVALADRRAGADVEQLADQARLVGVGAPLHEEQRAAVGGQQEADVLEDLVRQPRDVEVVADVHDELVHQRAGVQRPQLAVATPRGRRPRPSVRRGSAARRQEGRDSVDGRHHPAEGLPATLELLRGDLPRRRVGARAGARVRRRGAGLCRRGN